MPHMNNIFSSIPAPLPDELTEVLRAADGVRIERIVSLGHASPPGFWYDQDQAEWVIVLQGRAKVRFEEEAAPIDMKPGDFINIPAHRRHRVEWTTPEEPTIWLAVHYHPDSIHLDSTRAGKPISCSMDE
jgi:cupin 2 domain-containing protein